MEANRLIQELGSIHDKASAEEKADLAKKVSSLLESPLENAANLGFAQELVRTLAKDAEASVRATLASYMRSNPQLPKDVALQLANDIESIALPILESCNLITEAELIEIVANSGSAEKQIAIAKREDLTDNISAALVNHAKEDAVITTLLENQMAPISETVMHAIVEKQADNVLVMQALAQREAVPIGLLQKMTTEVSDRIRDAMLTKIQSKYGISAGQMESLSDHGTAISVLKILDNRPSLFDARSLVQNLLETRRMNPGIFMTALIMGKRHFAKCAIAEMSGTPFSAIEKMLENASMPETFEAALDKADLLSTFAVDIFSVLKFLETDAAAKLKTTHDLLQAMYVHINQSGDQFPNAHYFKMTLQSQPAFRAAP
jgi:uncharacterized protein (DUF2336 family)